VGDHRRIFAAMWRGKTAVMLAAFQGFSASHGGKKDKARCASYF